LVACRSIRGATGQLADPQQNGPGDGRSHGFSIRREARHRGDAAHRKGRIEVRQDLYASSYLDAGGGLGHHQTLATAIKCYLSELFHDGDENPPPDLYHRTVREIEYPLISVTLATTKGNQIKAAELLGLNRNTLRKKVRYLGTELAVIAFPGGRATLLETAPGISVAQVVAATEADLVIPDHVPEMVL
jgi:DNA-binding protein Fis